MNPEISILILTWNRAPYLAHCLKALSDALSPSISHEIIVMDNGSSDETPEILSAYDARPEWKIVRNPKNLGLAGYKKLFGLAKGRIMIELDDDVIEIPHGFDQSFIDYFRIFPDYGYLALNVVQDERTNGAKPDASHYTPDIRHGCTVLEGPTGGWCAAFHRKHYRPFRLLLNALHISMARTEDGILMALMQKVLRKRIGIIQDQVCLHACGPYFAKQFGRIRREIEKYTIGELPDRAKEYETFS